MEIRWTEEASFNLESIFNYIASNNPEAANKVISGIFQRTQIIRNNPEIGYTYLSRTGRQTRIFLYGHYKIIYMIKSQVIEILGVYHGAMDFKNLF